MSLTVLDPVVEQRTQQGEGPCAHIVRRDPGDPRSAAAIVLEARVNSTEVEALCGKRFIPQRDPKPLPVCDECADIAAQDDRLRGFDPAGLPS